MWKLTLTAFQVDLFIPPTVSPGRYKGQVLVSSKQKPIYLTFSVLVLPAALPSTSAFATEFGFNVRGAMKAQFGKDVYNTSVYRNLTKLYLDAALMHRVSSSAVA